MSTDRRKQLWRWLALATIVGAFVLAVIVFIVPGQQVPLLTGTGGLGSPNSNGITGCYTSSIVGDLVTDPATGTAIIEHDPSGVNGDHRWPVMWPVGRTGRQSGSEVEILDKTGKVLVRTGTRVRMMGGYHGDSPRVWVACGFVDALP